MSIPFVSLERSFDIRPLRRHVDPAQLNEPPHRHDFHELLWVRSGEGAHRIDGEQHPIRPRTVYLIARGQVHYFVQGIALEGYILRFSDDFLPVGTDGWTYRLTLFSHFSVQQALTPSQQAAAAIQRVMDAMWAEMGGAAFGREAMLRHQLSMLLLYLERVRLTLPHPTPEADDRLQMYQRFVTLLEAHFRQEHTVGYYARQLGMTPRQLSEVTKACAGQTAKALILERIMLEAKRYLQHSNESIKTIAYKLGFKDPAYFSKAFKREAGISPNAYSRE